MVIQKSKALRISILLSLVLFLVSWPNESVEQPILPEATNVTLSPAPAIEKPLDPLPAILKKIAWCESKNRQFNADGSVHRGEINPQDVGKYQINEHYHLEASIVLGMDIYTLEGNTEYAQYLYSTQGTTPWNWSKHCWSDPNRVWQKDGENYTSF